MPLGVITFEDKFKKSTTARICGVQDEAALKSLAQSLKVYTCAVIPQGSTTQVITDGGEPSNGKYGTVEQKAEMTFRKNDETEAGKRYFSMELPAPGENIFEETDNQGFRVIASVGEEFADAWSSVKNNDVEFTRGHMSSDKTSKAI